MDMKKVKLTVSAYVNYTGLLGSIPFVEGVSQEELPRHIRDRIAANFACVELGRSGDETLAGVQNRMISEAAERLSLAEPLARQTDEEKNAELIADAIKNAPDLDTKTREELEAIANKNGMKGLREISARWNVKHRSIPTLIEMILEAQDAALSKRKRSVAAEISGTAEEQEDDQASDDDGIVTLGATDAELEAARLEDEAELAAVALKAKEDALADAAASGDLSAAINATVEVTKEVTEEVALEAVAEDDKDKV